MPSPATSPHKNHIHVGVHVSLIGGLILGLVLVARPSFLLTAEPIRVVEDVLQAAPRPSGRPRNRPLHSRR